MKYVPTHRCPKCGKAASLVLAHASAFHWCSKDKNKFRPLPALCPEPNTEGNP